METQLRNEFTKLLQTYADIGGFSGNVLVKTSNNEFTFTTGFANKELDVPISKNSVFQIASLSMVFTSIATMILVQKDLINLDDPITKYLRDMDQYDQVTTDHLLSHRSGIPNINGLHDYSTLLVTEHTLDELLSEFIGLDLDFIPGEQTSKSNSNYIILAKLIETMSGKTYGEYLREEIFEKCGMDATGHPNNPNQLIPNRASGYQYQDHTNLCLSRYLVWSNKIGHGSLYSSMYDLYRFYRCLTSGELIREDLLNLCYKKMYGIFTKFIFKERVIYMSGLSPGFSSSFAYLPSKKVLVNILCNYYTPTPSLISDELLRKLIDPTYEMSYPPELKTSLPPNLEEYVGKYKFEDSFYSPDLLISIKEVNNNLVIDWGGHGLIYPLYISQDSFFIREYWGKFDFKRNSSQTVVEVMYQYGNSQHVAHRVVDR